MLRSHELVEDEGDLLGGVAVAEGLRLRPGGIELLDRIEDVLRVGPDDGVPTVLDGLDPLRLVAQGDARDAEEVRLLLHAAAVRDDLPRAHQEGDEIQVVDGLDRFHLGPQRLPEAERLQVLARARVDREHHGPAGLDQRLHDPLEGFAVVDAGGPMQRDEEILAFLYPEPLEDVPRASRLGTLEGDIIHHVPDQVHSAADPLFGEVIDRGLRGAEEEGGEVVRDDSINLLGHRPIERSQSGLDVSEGPPHLRRDERAGERGVRVSIHQDEVRLLPLEDVFETAHHLRSLPGMTAGSDSEAVVRACFRTMIFLLDCPSNPLRERGRGLLFSNSRITLKPLCAGVPSERSVRVAVIGLGYVGLPLAAAVAATGANVIGIDIDAEKVKAVNAGQSPLRGQEPGLADLVREQVAKGRLRASLDPKEASGVDAVALCVETPVDPTTHDPSYKALKAALAGLAPLLKRGALVSIESTLAPGTMEGVVRPALERGSKRTVGRDLYLVHCPERLTTGKLLHHLTELPRVLGANDEASMRKGVAFYERFVKAEIHATDWTTAEVVKTAENAYWDVQIAFANEVALISEELGVDAFRVRDLVNTCPYRMMLSPGAGVGGHCIPKDPWLLVSPAVQSKPELIPTAREVNDFMPRRMARIVEEALAA